MSWIDEIKLARWLNSGVAARQAYGVNMVGLGVGAVDNPDYPTTMPDGSVVVGRTELSFPDPNQPLIWFAAAAPAVAAERFLSNYGAYQVGQHGKIVPRGFLINAIRWQSKGITPAEAITIKLYHNGVAVGATWQMTIAGAVGPNYKQELRPSVPFSAGNGSVIALSFTQAGVSAATIRAVISVT